MHEETQKAIELLAKSEHVGLLLPARPTLDCLVAAEVLAELLKEQDKQVGFVTTLDSDTLTHSDLSVVASAPSLAKEFIISLNTETSPIAQLRYEKLQDRIDVVFSPKFSSVEERFVSFREGKVLCGCAILLGVPAIDSLGNVTSVGPDFFTETPLINIDTNPANEAYGEVNMVDNRRTALSEIAYELATNLRPQALDSGHATLLLAGIMSETKGFQSSATNADTLLVASELVRLGADHGQALALAKAPPPLPLLQLFGRVAVRSKIDEERGILWSFATDEDFEKTGRSAGDISAVLTHLEDTFPARTLIALLWQDPAERSVSAMLSGAPDLLAKIQDREPGTVNPPHLALAARFSSFRDAEEHLSSLLREVL